MIAKPPSRTKDPAPQAHLRRSKEGKKKGPRQRAKRGRYISDAILARRRRILDVAKEMIADSGTESFTVRDLGRLAKVSVTTIYAAFGDKEGVLAAAIDDFYQRLPFANRPAPTTLVGILECTDEATQAVFSNPPYARHYADLFFSPTIDSRIYEAIVETTNASAGYVPWLQKIFRSGDVLPGIDLQEILKMLASNRLMALRDWQQGRVSSEELSSVNKLSFLMLIRGITIGATQARLEAELRKQLRLASNRDV